MTLSPADGYAYGERGISHDQTTEYVGAMQVVAPPTSATGTVSPTVAPPAQVHRPGVDDYYDAFHTTLAVSWAPVPQALGYIVMRSTEGGFQNLSASTSPPDYYAMWYPTPPGSPTPSLLSLTDYNLSPGTTYHYRIIPYDGTTPVTGSTLLDTIYGSTAGTTNVL